MMKHLRSLKEPQNNEEIMIPKSDKHASTLIVAKLVYMVKKKNAEWFIHIHENSDVRDKTSQMDKP